MQRIDIDTDRLRTSCWVSGPEDGEPVLLLHGNLVSGRFWKAVADRLTDDLRIVAPDFRGFGHSEAKPIDATRGLDDWIDDTTALVKAIGWAGKPLHIGGWSMGGGMAVNPDFVRRMREGDTSSDEPVSSPRVTMTSFFWSPKYKAPDEDELLAETLLTQVGDDFYPGDGTASTNWPGMAAGKKGVNNAFAPTYCNVSAFGAIKSSFPVVWIRGNEDQVISDTSMFDMAFLGKLGAVPGWPGDDDCPPQPMLAQIRDVLDRYHRSSGAEVKEVVLEGVGHGPLLERSDRVAEVIAEAARQKA